MRAANDPGVDYRELVRRNVPDGEFVCSDVMSVDFEAGGFDGVVALYSIFHHPREEHGDLFRRIWGWLSPGGLLLCTLSHRSDEKTSLLDVPHYLVVDL